MSYWRYWQLEAAPFAGDASQRLFRGATVEEALARIDFLISHRRRVGTLVGDSGVGKSAVLRHVALNPQHSDEVPNQQLLRASMLGLGAGDLIVDIATRLTGRFGLRDSATAWRSLCDYFTAASREDLHIVLLVDDTEGSTAAAEGDLTRLLSMAFPLTMIFAVQSQLLSAVSRVVIDQTELQIELPNWDVIQTAEFLAWVVQGLGRTEPIFTECAIERIQELSAGTPRRIVQLSDLSLVAGAVSQADYIDAECVDQVAWELPKSRAA